LSHLWGPLYVVKERLDFQSDQGPTPLQQEFRKVHLRQVQKMSETFRFGLSDVENDNTWFRMASRMLGWRGEISAEFLEKNWIKSSRTPNCSSTFLQIQLKNISSLSGQVVELLAHAGE